MREHVCALFVLVACSTYPPADHAIVRNEPQHEASAPSLPATFKIVQYNVHRRPGESIARAISSDQDLRDADLVVLEEVPNAGPCGATCVAGRILGMHNVYEQDFLYKEGTLGQAILSRVPLYAPRIIPLPLYVNRNNALVVTLQIADQLVTVYAVHLTDELSLSERLRQMRPILEDAQHQTTPVIIAGDFNMAAAFYKHKLPVPGGKKASARFESYVRSYGFATPVANTGSTYRMIPLRLDGIYTRGFDTGSYGLAHAADVSDHLALWAVMTLRTPLAARP